MTGFMEQAQVIGEKLIEKIDYACNAIFGRLATFLDNLGEKVRNGDFDPSAKIGNAMAAMKPSHWMPGKGHDAPPMPTEKAAGAQSTKKMIEMAAPPRERHNADLGKGVHARMDMIEGIRGKMSGFMPGLDNESGNSAPMCPMAGMSFAGVGGVGGR